MATSGLVDSYWPYFPIGQYPNGPLGGLILILVLILLALLPALSLGVPLDLVQVSPWHRLRRSIIVLVSVIYGVSLLMVILWAYFFLPTLTGQCIDQFIIMLLAFVLFDTVHLAGTIHADTQGLDRG